MYIPPESLQHCPEGFQGYSVALEAMQGDLLGLLLEYNVAANRTIIMGELNAHVGKLPCGTPSNHLIAKHAGCLPLLTVYRFSGCKHSPSSREAPWIDFAQIMAILF